MIIGKLLPWVYCLDFTDMTILLIICSILFCSIHKRFLQSRVWKLIVAVLLIATFAGILYITLGTRTNGEIGQIRLIPLHSYREVINGGNPEILRSNFMNTVLFLSLIHIFMCDLINTYSLKKIAECLDINVVVIHLLYMVHLLRKVIRR